MMRSPVQAITPEQAVIDVERDTWKSCRRTDTQGAKLDSAEKILPSERQPYSLGGILVPLKPVCKNFPGEFVAKK
jgi:hypothetical protein